VGKGDAGVEILRLGGLSPERARELFERRARLDPEKLQSLAPEALAKLEGHPKFIELLASAIDEIPAASLMSGLLAASDIGEFVIGQVLGQLEAPALVVLRAATVFRGSFPFEALGFVRGALGEPTDDLAGQVRQLVQSAILEVSTEPQVTYYLHPILREALPGEPGQQATAHVAAARWYLREPFDATVLATWDDGLYHLRRAAEIGRRPDEVMAYKAFVFDHERSLSFAGWGRRLVAECQVLAGLAEELADQLVIQWLLGLELWQLEDNREAVKVFTALSDRLTELWATDPQEDLSPFLTLVKAKLGDAELKEGKIDRARELADEIEPVVEATKDLQYRLRYRELRFAIAREEVDLPAMKRWGDESFAVAEAWAQGEPSPQSLDALAEAHFNLGVTYLRLQQPAPMFEHFAEQLRIKLAIGKLPGVAAGLSNLGMLLISRDPISGVAMLLTSHQIERETGKAQPPWTATKFQAEIARFFEEPKNLDLGREAVETISVALVPYYRRGLEAQKGGR
jgi:tetratricopeptide (TPR) repeat protein